MCQWSSLPRWAVLFLAWGVAVVAQTVPRLVGNVMDSSTGRPIVGARVSLTNESSKEERVVFTEATGQFEYRDIPAVTYTLRVSHEGYPPFEHSKMQPPPGRTLRSNVELTRPRSPDSGAQLPYSDAQPLADELRRFRREWFESHSDNVIRKVRFELPGLVLQDDYSPRESAQWKISGPSYGCSIVRRLSDDDVAFIGLGAMVVVSQREQCGVDPLGERGQSPSFEHTFDRPYSFEDIAYLEAENSDARSAAMRHPRSRFAGIFLDRALPDGADAVQVALTESDVDRAGTRDTLEGFLSAYPDRASAKLLWNLALRNAMLGRLEEARRLMPAVAPEPRPDLDRLLVRGWTEVEERRAPSRWVPCGGLGLRGTRLRAVPFEGYVTGRCLKTSDGGLTFTKYGPPIPCGAMTRMAVLGEGSAVGVGERGFIARTQNSGESWTEVDRPTSRDLLAIAALDEHTLVVSGEGELLRSEDGGSHWTPATWPRRIQPLGLAVEHGWGLATGKPSALLVTRDSGRLWTVSWRGARRVPRAVTILGDRALVVGEAGLLLRTRDRGRTWMESTIRGDDGNPADLFDVAFVDWSTAVAIGADAVLLRTTDGGRRWNEVARSRDWATLPIVKEPPNAGSLPTSAPQPVPPTRPDVAEEVELRHPVGIDLSENRDQVAQKLGIRVPWSVSFATDRVGLATTGTAVLRTEDGGINWFAVGAGLYPLGYGRAVMGRAPVSRPSARDRAVCTEPESKR